MPPTLALIGLRCTGKSSLGEQLAQRLGRPFVDLDEEIVRSLGPGSPYSSAGAVLAAHGEEVFRAFESRALEHVLASDGQVLATGGGVVERARNRRLLAERARCVWLHAGSDILAQRLRADGALRPALTGGDPADELVQLARRREPWYRELAELRIDTGELDLEASLKALLASGLQGSEAAP